jgi:dTDP-4-dehydrorhamnose reductase
MRVLVIGAAGQLGSEVCSRLAEGFEVVPATRVDLDITNLETARRFVQKAKPDVVINAAAYTDVDGCETNEERAFRVNAAGARNVALASHEAGAKLVHISTDYVFDGRKEASYVEYDSPNPLNVYGWSKLVGEQMVKEQNPRTFILRVAWLYGSSGKNFVKTVLSLAKERDELKVVDDQRGTPTFAGDVADQIKRLVRTDRYGLYHCTSQGSCTWYEFAQEIFRLASVPVCLVPVTTAELPRPARRPANSVLDNFMLRVEGLDLMPEWRESLARFISGIAQRRGM